MVRFAFVCIVLAACGNDHALGSDYEGTGLPCEVQRVLETYCQGCHGNPTQNAPVSLVSYDDLTMYVSGGTMAQLAVDRMKSIGPVMPPTPLAIAPAADISTLQAWIDSGMPPGSCAPGPFDVAPTCTSGRHYTGGEGGSMEPGMPCLNCHRSGEERLTVGGTVYATGHEPNRCYGAMGGAVVEITDANGAKHNLTVNGGGNFYYQGLLATPYTAKVIANGKERVMLASQTNGDCNACHTADGAMMAPGRIAMP